MCVGECVASKNKRSIPGLVERLSSDGLQHSRILFLDEEAPGD